MLILMRETQKRKEIRQKKQNEKKEEEEWNHSTRRGSSGRVGGVVGSGGVGFCLLVWRKKKGE